MIGLCSNDGELYYIYSLATSKNHRGVAPNGQGCNVESGVNYWYFQPGVALDEDGFSFDLPTYLFFNGNFRKRSYAELRKIGSDGSPFGVQKLAQLDELVVKRLLKCVLKAKAMLPRNIVPVLEAFKDTLSSIEG